MILLAATLAALFLAFCGGAKILFTSLERRAKPESFCVKCGENLTAVLADAGLPRPGSTQSPLPSDAAIHLSTVPSDVAPAPTHPLRGDPVVDLSAETSDPVAMPGVPPIVICPRCRRLLASEQVVTCTRSDVRLGRAALGLLIVMTVAAITAWRIPALWSSAVQQSPAPTIAP